MNRAWPAVGAVLLGAAVASCATLPTSGSIQLRTLKDPGVEGQTGLQVEPVPPGQAWSPKETVQGFLAASASFGNHHRIARDYLTRSFARSWRPGAGATVVDSPGFVQSSPLHNVVVTGGQKGETVTVSGKRFATLVTAGQDQAGSVVVAPATTVFRFSLVQQDGAWRIDSIDESAGSKPSVPAPKTLLLLTRPDFERDYLARDIYFFRAAPASNMLIPDPVYFPQTGLVAEVRGLVNALIQPRCRDPKKRASGNCPTTPPDNSWLYGAAVSAFPRGVRPVRPVQVVGGTQVTVDLGNTAAKTTQDQRKRMAAQLAWSLTGSPYGAQASQIRSVLLLFGHEKMQARLAAGWVPRSQGYSWLYYQVPGSPVQQPQVVLHTGTSQPFPMPLPAKAGSSFTSMAASPAPMGSIVLAGCTGNTVYLMPQAMAPAVVTRRLSGTCTSLSWDREGNLWIATTEGAVVLQGAGGSAPRSAKLVRVYIPPLQPNAKATTLRIAPDGVRVAMIVPSGATSKIMIAAISRNSLGTYTYVAQTSEMLRVGSDLVHPIAVSWLSPDVLLVLDRSGGRNEIYQVPLNGGVSTEVSAPPGVTALSTTWPANATSPRVVIGIAPSADTPARIETSQGSLLNPDWQPVGTGVMPVFPG